MKQVRARGHPVDRRDRFEDGQPSRDAEYRCALSSCLIYNLLITSRIALSYFRNSVKEERERKKREALEHPKKRQYKTRNANEVGLKQVGSEKGNSGGGRAAPPRMEL